MAGFLAWRMAGFILMAILMFQCFSHLLTVNGFGLRMQITLIFIHMIENRGSITLLRILLQRSLFFITTVLKAGWDLHMEAWSSNSSCHTQKKGLLTRKDSLSILFVTPQFPCC